MRYRNAAIESLLEQTTMMWRWMRFLQRTLTLAIIVAAVVLLLGVGMAVGWLTNEIVVQVGLVLLAVGAIALWAMIGLITAVTQLDRSWVAARVEHAHQPLMDRLNTLVYLQHDRDPQKQLLADHIEKQATVVLRGEPSRVPFTWAPILARLVLLLLILTTTVLFYGAAHPWQRLAANVPVEDVPPDDGDGSLLEIPPPEEDEQWMPQEQTPWGGVRIAEPGVDLRATILDVVPLRIEAAANRELKNVEWVTVVNQQTPTRHELPPPDSRWHAVYQPLLDLQQQGVETWDVLSYYARATTKEGQSYESELYFIELVPFREDLEEWSRESPDADVALLERLSDMIQRQQEVLRETHRQQRNNEPPDAERQQVLQRLAREEASLGKMSQHVAAEAESRFTKSESGELNSEMREAESALADAEKTLRDQNPAAARDHEQAALQSMVRARKQLEKVERSLADPSALADMKSADEQLQRIRAQQQQLRSARADVKKILLDERNLEKKANPSNLTQLPQLAPQQDQLVRSLQQTIQDHPESFQPCPSACDSAQSAMQDASRSLQSKNRNARQDLGRAAESLQQLDQALEQQLQQSELAEAHALRRQLDEQIARLSQCQKQGGTPGQCQQMARQAGQCASGLKQIAEGAAGGAFGSALQQALSDENLRELQQKSGQLSAAPGTAQQQRAAGELAQELEKLARAFDASLPQGAGGRLPHPALQPDRHESLARGLRALESAARRQQATRPLTNQQRSQLAREAMRHLQSGIPSTYGDNESSRQMLGELEQRLQRPDFAMDMHLVRDLMQEIQKLGLEISDDEAAREETTGTTYIDPAQLPPAYRRSIEKYFERLSEDP